MAAAAATARHKAHKRTIPVHQFWFILLHQTLVVGCLCEFSHLLLRLYPSLSLNHMLCVASLHYQFLLMLLKNLFLLIAPAMARIAY